jgi:YVTN family beta-propeller protein
MTDDATSQDRSIGAPRAGQMPASGWSDTTAAARVVVLMALIVLAGGSLVVLVSGTTPRPGLPPFLVQGEDELTGWSLNRVLPVVLSIAGGLGVLGLAAARQRSYIGRWLALLAATWVVAWLAWNFMPSMASTLIASLLLEVNGIAIGGARWSIFRRHDGSGTPAGSGRDDVRRVRGIAAWWPHLALGAAVLLLGGAIAAPAVAQRIVAQPRGTLTTIAIAAPPEVDDGVIVADPGSGRAVLLLRTNYLEPFDVRVLKGTVVTLDSGRGTLVRTLSLDLYPGTLAVDSHLGRAFINAVSEFGTDTALNTLHVLDLRTGTMMRVLSRGTYLIDVAVDQRTDHVFAADSAANRVYLLDARTGALLRTIKVGQSPEQVVVAAGADRVFVVNTGDDTHPGSLSLLDATSGAVVRTVPSDAGYNYDVFAVDDRTGRVFGTADRTVRVWDARSGAELARIKIPGGRTSTLALGAGTNRLFVVNSDHQSVSMLDARSGRILRTIPVGLQPCALAVDERTHRVFVVNAGSDSVSVLDATTGQTLDTLPVGVTPIAIGVDARLGHAVVYNAASATVSVLETRTGQRHF